MRAVVVAHGEVDPSDVTHVRAADLILAADGGAAHLARWGIEPAVIVGDLDSLTGDARSRIDPARVERWPATKDKTDTELAVDRAIASGADEVVVIGALGGPRLDHAMANALLLALERPSRASVRVVRGPTSMRVVRGGETADLSVRVGDLVTLLAVGGDAGGVRTEGLRYALRGETLRLGSSRGVSNEVAAPGAKVTLGSGVLLVVESSTPGSSASQPEPNTKQ